MYSMCLNNIICKSKYFAECCNITFCIILQCKYYIYKMQLYLYILITYIRNAAIVL